MCDRENGGIFHNVREGIWGGMTLIFTFLVEDWAVHNCAPYLLENYLNPKKCFKTTWK